MTTDDDRDRLDDEAVDGKLFEPPPMADDYSERIATFLEQNPLSRVEVREDGAFLMEPWGDASLMLRLRDSALLDDLNCVLLPPEFTAVVHLDTRAVEIIWGPLPRSSTYVTRSFDYHFRGAAVRCEFAPASDRLERLARASQPRGAPGPSSFRNLNGISLFLHQRSEHQERTELDLVLTSFWIRDVEWSVSWFADFARTLNFFMSYFDPHTPRILVHEVEEKVHPVKHGVAQEFPTSIVGSDLDPYLLSLWESAIESRDVIRTFLHNYQVLEYAAFYHLDSEIKSRVLRTLRQPDALADLDRTIRSLLDAIADDRRRDEAKLVALIGEACDPQRVWNFIEANIDRFTEPVTFDGGFELGALVKDHWTVEDFCGHWMPSLPDHIRKIRNALVHGREQRQSSAIAPTRANIERLRPWALLVDAIAMNAILNVRS